MSISRFRFRPARLLAALAGGLGIVAMLGPAASASSSGDASGGVSSARGAPAVTSGGTWRTAEEVPGTAALNRHGNAEIVSVSCAAPGSCSGGGSYRDGSRRDQAFVVSETAGVWRTAVEVPGTAALNAGGLAEVTSVSCASAGNCSAGGYYADGSFHAQAFVVSETSGIWRTATEVPGTSALNAGGNAEVTSVSCASAGNCAAGGEYRNSSGQLQAFVASEVNGIWRSAEEVPGTAALNAGGFALTASVSCASAGNCSAGGEYTDGSQTGQAFVVNETSGVWRTAMEVPGTAALNANGDAEILSVSCASPGTCSAGGTYDHSVMAYEFGQAFVVSETNGIWHTAKEVPGTAALNVGGAAETMSVSCATAGNCSAGGTYLARHNQAFVVDEVSGVWRTAEEVPGTAALNRGGGAQTLSVSCATARNCSAGGEYIDGHSFAQQAFVDNKT